MIVITVMISSIWLMVAHKLIFRFFHLYVPAVHSNYVPMGSCVREELKVMRVSEMVAAEMTLAGAFLLRKWLFLLERNVMCR